MADQDQSRTEFDESLETDDRLTVVKAITRFRQESEQARERRLRENRRNRDVYLGRQDWAHKQDGQSREFLPKVAVSAEQMSAFVKRGLVQFGDWFSVDVDRELADRIDGTQIRAIIKCFLSNIWERNNKSTNIATIISDAVKNGLLESMMILKVHGAMMPTRTFSAVPGEDGTLTPRMTDDMEWRLRIDLVRPEDYYPDPTGNGLYEIHRVERDLHEVVEQAAQGIYDAAAVQQLINVDYKRPENEGRSEHDRNQEETVTPAFRKRVVLDEFWGTILHEDGTVAHRNIVATMANDKILIRGPEPNPFWHQESPFLAAPLIRVPWSTWHKALYDHASDLNLALNEMFNLMLDGGMASVWGIKQIRLDELEDPGQVSGGLKQGSTIAVKSTLPHGTSAVERVDTGQVPQDAMSMFEALNREYTQAALTNELKLGTMPGKEVRATEVIEASQSQATLLDGIISDIEASFIKPLLHKAWLTILQNADDIPPEALMSVADRQVAILIMRASPAERFALFAGKCAFRVNGLSGTMARALDFQKAMALLQAVTSNPALFQAFMRKFSPDKTLRYLMRTLNLNADDIEKDAEELAQFDQEMQEIQQMAQMMGGGQAEGAPAGMNGSGGLAAAGQGDPTSAQINQETNPRTGLVPNS